jgi:hypothetical protein
VFLIVFSVGHALPLAFTRFSVREGVALNPRNGHARHAASGHGPGQSTDTLRPRPRTVPVRGQDISPFSPCPRAVHARGRVPGHTSARTVHELVLATDRERPRPVRSFGQSTSTALPRTGAICVLQAATDSPRRGNTMATSRPPSLPIAFTMIPAYVHLRSHRCPPGSRAIYTAPSAEVPRPVPGQGSHCRVARETRLLSRHCRTAHPTLPPGQQTPHRLCPGDALRTALPTSDLRVKSCHESVAGWLAASRRKPNESVRRNWSDIGFP